MRFTPALVAAFAAAVHLADAAPVALTVTVGPSALAPGSSAAVADSSDAVFTHPVAKKPLDPKIQQCLDYVKNKIPPGDVMEIAKSNAVAFCERVKDLHLQRPQLPSGKVAKAVLCSMYSDHCEKALKAECVSVVDTNMHNGKPTGISAIHIAKMRAKKDDFCDEAVKIAVKEDLDVAEAVPKVFKKMFPHGPHEQTRDNCYKHIKALEAKMERRSPPVSCGAMPCKTVTDCGCNTSESPCNALQLALPKGVPGSCTNICQTGANAHCKVMPIGAPKPLPLHERMVLTKRDAYCDKVVEAAEAAKFPPSSNKAAWGKIGSAAFSATFAKEMRAEKRKETRMKCLRMMDKKKAEAQGGGPAMCGPMPCKTATNCGCRTSDEPCSDATIKAGKCKNYCQEGKHAHCKHDPSLLITKPNFPGPRETLMINYPGRFCDELTKVVEEKDFKVKGKQWDTASFSAGTRAFGAQFYGAYQNWCADFLLNHAKKGHPIAKAAFAKKDEVCRCTAQSSQQKGFPNGSEMGKIILPCASRFVNTDEMMRNKFKADCLKHVTPSTCPMVAKKMGPVIGNLCKKVTEAKKETSFCSHLAFLYVEAKKTNSKPDMNAMAKKAYESTAEKIDHFSSKQEQINRWAKGCIMTLNNPAQIARLPAVAQQVVAIVKETKKIEAFCSAVAKKMGELNFPADKTRVVETAINVFKTEFPAGLKELKKRNEVKNCVKFVESHSKTPRIQVIAELKRTREYCNDCAQKIADAGFPEGSKKQLLYNAVYTTMFSGHYKTLEDSFRKSCSDMISKATRPETKKLVTSGNVGRYCDMVTDEVKKRSFPRDQHVLANIYRSTFEQKFSNLVHEIANEATSTQAPPKATKGPKAAKAPKAA